MRSIPVWCILFFAGFSAACATEELPLRTVEGSSSGDVHEQLLVLGVARRVTTSLNQEGDFYREDLEVDVPVGTQLVVPTVEGCDLAYAVADPNTLDAFLDDPPRYSPDDHNFGRSICFVRVKELHPPKGIAGLPGSYHQKAKVEVILGLVDKNSDDDWFGWVSYHLLFLGQPQEGRPILGPKEWRPLELQP